MCVEMIEVVPVRVDQLLSNWGRWAREGMGARGRARSAEGRYRAEPLANTVGGDEVDAGEAVLVESVMRFLPVKERGLLVGHYVRRLSWQPLSRALALPMQRPRYDRMLREAAMMAWNRYEVVASRRNARIHSAPQFASA